MCKESNPVDM